MNHQATQQRDSEEGAMKMKWNIHVVLIGLALLLGLAGAAWAGGLPQEPSDEYLVNEDINIITGLYLREYSLADNGIVDYKTARQILVAGYNEYWNTVVETKAFPLFYWYDANHDGHFAMWVDRQVEGCACDIVRYDAE